MKYGGSAARSPMRTRISSKTSSIPDQSPRWNRLAQTQLRQWVDRPSAPSARSAPALPSRTASSKFPIMVWAQAFMAKMSPTSQGPRSPRRSRAVGPGGRVPLLPIHPLADDRGGRAVERRRLEIEASESSGDLGGACTALERPRRSCSSISTRQPNPKGWNARSVSSRMPSSDSSDSRCENPMSRYRRTSSTAGNSRIDPGQRRGSRSPPRTSRRSRAHPGRVDQPQVECLLQGAPGQVASIVVLGDDPELLERGDPLHGRGGEPQGLLGHRDRLDHREPVPRLAGDVQERRHRASAQLLGPLGRVLRPRGAEASR